ncbi:hypothetical protein ACQ856_30420 (plasmid) [Mycolicibacterium psychrotolerans]|uniref:hypothetical protein n=1 Tax=Mycolicibacterium psychrotolerans TaxID=216929 RepID=UPI003D66F14D
MRGERPESGGGACQQQAGEQDGAGVTGVQGAQGRDDGDGQPDGGRDRHGQP